MSENYPDQLNPWREPKAREDENVIRSEHGRIAFNIDYRSHWFVLVQGPSKHQYAIMVKHGGGEERIQMPTVNFKEIAAVIAALPSDEAYLLMHQLYDIHKDAVREARRQTAKEYREAFVEGRLKKRKLPAQGTVKVWIEDPAVQRHRLGIPPEMEVQA